MTEYTKVCEHHFRPEEIRKQFCGRKDLKDTILDLLGVKVNITAFLAGKEQLDREDVVMSQTIASVRIHVERIIARIEKFKVLKTEIPLNLNGPDHKPNMNSGLSSLQLYGPTH